MYAGLDLSRKRLDFHLLDGEGATVAVGAAPPDPDGLRGLSDRLARHGEPVRAAIASMNGARSVHDQLELDGWQVEIADAQRAKGLAPLACKTDRIDAAPDRSRSCVSEESRRCLNGPPFGVAATPAASGLTA
jgi:transposase